jgi:eukaryotic-like serine/threonine-protein kinase
MSTVRTTISFHAVVLAAGLALCSADARSQETTGPPPPPPPTIVSVAWSPDGKRLAALGSNGTAKVWEAQAGRQLLTLNAGPGVSSLAWSPDGDRLAAGGEDYAKVWDAETGKELLTVSNPRLGVSVVAWSPDGERLITGTSYGTANVWDAETGKELLAFGGQGGDQGGCVPGSPLSPDGKHLVTGTKVWDAETGKELLGLGDQGACVASSPWSPDGKRLATAKAPEGPEPTLTRRGAEGVVNVWDVETGKELFTVGRRGVHVLNVAWSPDGKRLAAAALATTVPTTRTVRSSFEVEVWDAEAGKELLALSGVGPLGSMAAWSPDGTRLAAATSHGLTVWDADTGKELLPRSQARAGSMLAWSPDSKRLVTLGDGGAIVVWDAETKKELLTIKGLLDVSEGSSSSGPP